MSHQAIENFNFNSCNLKTVLRVSRDSGGWYQRFPRRPGRRKALEEWGQEGAPRFLECEKLLVSHLDWG